MSDARRRLRLTSAGVLAVIGGIVCQLGSRLFGVVELGWMSWALLSAPITSLVAVGIASTSVRVQRTLRQRRVSVGDTISSTVSMSNPRRWGRLPAVIELHLDGHIVSRRTVPQRNIGPDHPHVVHVSAHSTPALRRGIVTHGPVCARLLDPFGLVSASVVNREVDRLLVVPRVVDLGALDPSGTHENGSTHRRQHRPIGGEEFEKLREYLPGDDVRRVHWPSTARLGRPLVRQFEPPAQRRTTVILDNRRADGASSVPGPDRAEPGSNDDAFERAVSAAASVLTLAQREGDLARLILTDGTASDYVFDDRNLEQVLDLLAVADTSTEARLPSALELGGVDDRLIVCSSSLRSVDLEQIAQRGWSRPPVVIDCSDDPTAANLGTDPHRRSVTLIGYGRGADLRRQWVEQVQLVGSP